MFRLLTLMGLMLISLTVSADHHPNRLIVKMISGHDMPQNDLITKSKHLFGTMYVVHTNNLQELESRLLEDKGVLYVERDQKSPKSELPVAQPLLPSQWDMEKEAGQFNDPRLSKQWTFKNSERGGISISRAYQNRRSQPREEIIVAVVDTGVDYTHEDLKEVMWTNPGEIAGNGIDDDGNGYIDDIHGINTLVRDSDGNATVNMKDTHSHGTHVSGSIGAQQNNGKGIAGIAGNVKIMGIRTVPNSSDELDVDVIEAFLYAAKMGAKVINCSFGKDRNEGGMAVSETIEHIRDTYGVLVVAAAGNSSRNIDRRPTYPASFANDNLLVVASTSSRGSMSYFSNYGLTGVDVAAPGSGILSTTPNNRYSSMSGTSMASPNTAGVAAEVLAHYPELGPVELKKVLMDSVTKSSRYNGKVVSGGRVDLEKALELASQQ
ncbi:MAG: S8 family serine peptidase [Bacteriovoracaceae bacterium]|nr:S8 family serine peptidase [Bacteriovoracaceae bacterium]